MKKTSNRLRSLGAVLAVLALLLALAVPAFAVEGGFADLYYRMFDDAEVLTEDEDNELEDALEELSLRQSFDVTIATIESMESVGADSMEQFADDLYDYCQYGYGPDMDGVLLLVSVGDRKWHISTCGYGITAFTDAGIQYLGEQMTPFMADGDYAGAFRTFVQWSDTYIDAAREGHPYDVNNLPREPLSLMYLFLALGIGLVLAWVVVHVMKSQLRSVAFQENAASYVREGSMNLTNSRELFLYRDVHRTERPKESSSSDSGTQGLPSACSALLAGCIPSAWTCRPRTPPTWEAMCSGSWWGPCLWRGLPAGRPAATTQGPSPGGWRATPGRRCPCGGCTTASAWMQRTLHGILKTAISQTSVWTWTKRWSANGPCPATTQNGAEPSQLKQKGAFSWDFLIR